MLLTLLTLMAFSLSPVGRSCPSSPLRSRATYWVTPTPVMSSFICWCHVFLGRPRRLVPGTARSITLRVTLFASLLWTCPNQRRQSLRITSLIGERCNMRRISALETPRIPRKHPHLCGTNLPLVVHLHRPAFTSIRYIMPSYTVALSLRGIFRSYNTPVNFLQLDHAACTRRSTSRSMVPSLSITDPRYLKWSTFFSSSL